MLQFQLDRTAYERLIVSRFPAYKTDSYKNVNKDKVLIHQEGLAQGTNAVTKTDAELEKIFTEGEDYNVGFSSDQVAEVDKAIREITILS